jgi:hypothetical protein
MSVDGMDDVDGADAWRARDTALLRGTPDEEGIARPGDR